MDHIDSRGWDWREQGGIYNTEEFPHFLRLCLALTPVLGTGAIWPLISRSPQSTEPRLKTNWELRRKEKGKKL